MKKEKSKKRKYENLAEEKDEVGRREEVKTKRMMTWML